MTPSLQKVATSYLLIPLAAKSEVFAMPPLFSITFFKISFLFKQAPTFCVQFQNIVCRYYSVCFEKLQLLNTYIFLNLRVNRQKKYCRSGRFTKRYGTPSESCHPRVLSFMTVCDYLLQAYSISFFHYTNPIQRPPQKKDDCTEQAFLPTETRINGSRRCSCFRCNRP